MTAIKKLPEMPSPKLNKLLLIAQLKVLPHSIKLDREVWDKVPNKLLEIAEYLIDHCWCHSIPLVINEVKPSYFSISIKGWSAHDIEFLYMVCGNNLKTSTLIEQKDPKSKELTFKISKE